MLHGLQEVDGGLDAVRIAVECAQDVAVATHAHETADGPGDVGVLDGEPFLGAAAADGAAAVLSGQSLGVLAGTQAVGSLDIAVMDPVRLGPGLFLGVAARP